MLELLRQLFSMWIDCCDAGGFGRSIKNMFWKWSDMTVRLDVFHFMKRISQCVTTSYHPLYVPFMSELSACIFEWCKEDLALLSQAKTEELKKEGLHLNEAAVRSRLTKKEMSLHCRRTTRGENATIGFIGKLINNYVSDFGKDTLGVPLLDEERIRATWDTQRKHVKCIQDPPGALEYLYRDTETGHVVKGGVQLKTYRCARGSSSLESFHAHLKNFIPGTSASAAQKESSQMLMYTAVHGLLNNWTLVCKIKLGFNLVEIFKVWLNHGRYPKLVRLQPKVKKSLNTKFVLSMSGMTRRKY